MSDRHGAAVHGCFPWEEEKRRNSKNKNKKCVKGLCMHSQPRPVREGRKARSEEPTRRGEAIPANVQACACSIPAQPPGRWGLDCAASDWPRRASRPLGGGGFVFAGLPRSPGSSRCVRCCVLRAAAAASCRARPGGGLCLQALRRVPLLARLRERTRRREQQRGAGSQCEIERQSAASQPASPGQSAPVQPPSSARSESPSGGRIAVSLVALLQRICLPAPSNCTHSICLRRPESDRLCPRDPIAAARTAPGRTQRRAAEQRGTASQPASQPAARSAAQRQQTRRPSARRRSVRPSRPGGPGRRCLSARRRRRRPPPTPPPRRPAAGWPPPPPPAPPPPPPPPPPRLRCFWPSLTLRAGYLHLPGKGILPSVLHRLQRPHTLPPTHPPPPPIRLCWPFL